MRRGRGRGCTACRRERPPTWSAACRTAATTGKSRNCSREQASGTPSENSHSPKRSGGSLSSGPLRSRRISTRSSRRGMRGPSLPGSSHATPPLSDASSEVPYRPAAAGSGNRNDAQIVGGPGLTQRYAGNDDQTIAGAAELLTSRKLRRPPDHLLVALHLLAKHAVCTPQEAETTGYFHAGRGGEDRHPGPLACNAPRCCTARGIG